MELAIIILAFCCLLVYGLFGALNALTELIIPLLISDSSPPLSDYALNALATWSAAGLTLFAVLLWFVCSRICPMKRSTRFRSSSVWRPLRWFLGIEIVRHDRPDCTLLDEIVQRRNNNVSSSSDFGRPRRVLLCVYPHGIVPVGAIAALGTYTDDSFAAGLNAYAGISYMAFWLPFVREMVLLAGGLDARPASLRRWLRAFKLGDDEESGARNSPEDRDDTSHGPFASVLLDADHYTDHCDDGSYGPVAGAGDSSPLRKGSNRASSGTHWSHETKAASASGTECEQDLALVLTPGGLREMARTRYRRVDLYLHHHGFVELAKEMECDAVFPVYVENETSTFWTINLLPLSFRDWCITTLGYPFPTLCVPVPWRRRLKVHIGKPLLPANFDNGAMKFFERLTELVAEVESTSTVQVNVWVTSTECLALDEFRAMACDRRKLYFNRRQTNQFKTKYDGKASNPLSPDVVDLDSSSEELGG